MQAANYTISGARLIILHKDRINSRRTITLFVIRLNEISTSIFKYLRLNDNEPFNRSLNDIHYIVTFIAIRMPLRSHGPKPSICVKRRTYSTLKNLKMFSIPTVISI